MRIAIIGARGQLGTDLQSVLGGQVTPLAHGDIEITAPESISAALTHANPELVINCAAYNLVDRAEEEPQQAYAVNALGPRNLALFCGSRDIALLHVSTDYVFGLDHTRRTPFLESDLPGPVSAYGTSKLAGEYFVRSLCPKHFVVRTCGLYGHVASRGKGNFVETMLRLGAERKHLTVVDDQRCTPTLTADLAAALDALVQTEAYGLYHATNSGDMTWCEFAREIFRQSRMEVDVEPIASAQFAAKAARPHYSVLDISKLGGVIGRALPPWQEALSRYLSGRRS